MPAKFSLELNLKALQMAAKADPLQACIDGIKENEPRTPKFEIAVACLLEGLKKLAKKIAWEHSVDWVEAEAIFLESILVLIEKIKNGKYEPREGIPISAFFSRIFKYKLLKYIRDKGRGGGSNSSASNEGSQGSVEDDYVEEEQEELEYKIFKECWGNLSERCQIILGGIIYLDKSLEEIAVELGITYASARNLKWRCKKKLIECCKEQLAKQDGI